MSFYTYREDHTEPVCSFGPVDEMTALYSPHQTRLDATDQQQLEAGADLGDAVAAFGVHPGFTLLGNGFGGSLALAFKALEAGVQLLRVHDVPETVQAVRVWRGLRDAALTDFAQLPE